MSSNHNRFMNSYALFMQDLTDQNCKLVLTNELPKLCESKVAGIQKSRVLTSLKNTVQIKSAKPRSVYSLF